VHNGGRYVALSAAIALAGAKPWSPIAPAGTPSPDGGDDSGGGGGNPGAYAGGAVAVDAALRVALQRLFTTPLAVGTGVPPQFLYINHLGWCRGCARRGAPGAGGATRPPHWGRGSSCGGAALPWPRPIRAAGPPLLWCPKHRC
jgi:hypothetical protein